MIRIAKPRINKSGKKFLFLYMYLFNIQQGIINDHAKNIKCKITIKNFSITISIYLIQLLSSPLLSSYWLNNIDKEFDPDVLASLTSFLGEVSLILLLSSNGFDIELAGGRFDEVEESLVIGVDISEILFRLSLFFEESPPCRLALTLLTTKPNPFFCSKSDCLLLVAFPIVFKAWSFLSAFESLFCGLLLFAKMSAVEISPRLTSRF